MKENENRRWRIENRGLCHLSSSILHPRFRNDRVSTGIILRTHPLTETSLIVHWLTPDFGRIATVAKGARRPESPFLGKLDLFYGRIFRSAAADVPICTCSAKSVCAKPTTRCAHDLRRLRQAAYAAAFVEQATETETPLPAIFDLMNSFLDHLCGPKPAPQLVLAFELKLLQELGLKPDLGKTNLHPAQEKSSMR